MTVKMKVWGVVQSKSVNKMHHHLRSRKREKRVIVVTLF